MFYLDGSWRVGFYFIYIVLNIDGCRITMRNWKGAGILIYFMYRNIWNKLLKRVVLVGFVKVESGYNLGKIVGVVEKIVKWD